MRKWVPLLLLASAQFVMVLDTSVMNVAISQIVEDLDTTIQGVQTAITLYTLVMAAFMLLGAKLGDILGRNRTFAIGLVVYGVGSLTTALSPNLGVLLIGWSGIEGLGAVLVIPAIAALTAAGYEGRERALAYALLGGVAAIAVAAGPLIGGWVTTEYSWRYVFAAETVVMVVILLLLGQIPRAVSAARRPQLDIIGVALSASGLGLMVFAILRSSVWGFVKPRTPPTIDGTEITPLGFSPVPFLVLGGLALLGAFVLWQQRRARLGRDQLLDTTLLRVPQLRAGLSTLLGQQLVLMGTFFVIPVYLQVVLGLDAFETGKRLLPLSLAMLVFALLGPRMAARRSPRTVAQLGLVAVSIGSIVMLATLDVRLNDPGFKVALAVIGAGAGLLASQLGNVIMSSVAPDKSSEGGGLQGTAQNLGSSLGTAIIGAVLLASLATGVSQRVADNPDIPADARERSSRSRGGNRHRARRRRRAGRGRRRAHAGPGRCRCHRLRRRAARSAAARTRCCRACRTPVALVHPTPADALSRRERGAGPGAGGHGSLGAAPWPPQVHAGRADSLGRNAVDPRESHVRAPSKPSHLRQRHRLCGALHGHERDGLRPVAAQGERGRQAAQAGRRDREEGRSMRGSRARSASKATGQLLTWALGVDGPQPMPSSSGSRTRRCQSQPSRAAVRSCAGGVDRAVGPAGEQGADEALCLAVGLGPVGAGAQVAHAERRGRRSRAPSSDRRSRCRSSRRSTLMPWRRRSATARLQEADRGRRLLVAQDLALGQAGAVVDGDVDVLPADGLAALAARSVNVRL